MNKVFISFCTLCFLYQAALADENVEAFPQTSEEVEDKGISEDNPEKGFGGFFGEIGCWFGGPKVDCRVRERIIDATFPLGARNFQALGGGFNHRRAIGLFVFAEAQRVLSYVGAPNNVTAISLSSSVDRKMCNVNASNRVGGNVGAGWGTFINDNVYLGVAFNFAVAGSRNSEYRDDSWEGGLYTTGKNVFAKVSGFVPTCALRIGNYCKSVGALVCLRGGFAYLKSQISSDRDNIKFSDVTPLVGAGFEKNLGPVVVKLEADYFLGVKKTKTLNFGDAIPDPQVRFSYRQKITAESSGFAVRFVVVRHLKGLGGI
jgi:hypothetical protein